MSESEDSDNCTPPDILEAASKMTMNLLPAKSRINYDKCYHEFMAWKLLLCNNNMAGSPYVVATSHINDRLSLKNLLFTRSIPQHVVPVPTKGFRIYSCTDCGDKFMFQSSYDYHVNRKSCKITFLCSMCSKSYIFYNRCKLLSHIRSHSFKTATINVNDLKVEPLPSSFFVKTRSIPSDQRIACVDCGQFIPMTGNPPNDRALHYMRHTNEIHTCPICLYKLPTICGLKAHIRLHLKQPCPSCPECGQFLTKNTDLIYPYTHQCEGFNFMRVTKRLKCPLNNCIAFHPSQYMEHMKTHLKKVYKCSNCYVACYTIETLQQHAKTHKEIVKPVQFYQCKLCPGRLVLNNQSENHLRTHYNAAVNVFPCWGCGLEFGDCQSLLIHSDSNSCQSQTKTGSGLSDSGLSNIYRVVKRCDRCCQSFTYRCRKEEIDTLPIECPFKCLVNSAATSDAITDNNPTQPQLVCHICQNKVDNEWEEIKKHFTSTHPLYKCLDLKVVVQKLDISKYVDKEKVPDKKLRNRKRNRSPKDVGTVTAKTQKVTKDTLSCGKCDESFDSVENYEKHIVSHRDPCTAYQCMECGECFVVKPSFSKHLLLKHGISDVEIYVANKQCYNENALDKYHDANQEPVKENQCKICREQFTCQDDFEKHFRVHGMAFLQKTKNRTSP